jgi:hypothetical protein
MWTKKQNKGKEKVGTTSTKEANLDKSMPIMVEPSSI